MRKFRIPRTRHAAIYGAIYYYCIYARRVVHDTHLHYINVPIRIIYIRVQSVYIVCSVCGRPQFIIYYYYFIGS